METTTIELKPSKAKIIVVSLLFMISFFIVFYLLHAWFFYLGLLLCLFAAMGSLMSYYSKQKINCIHVIETAYAREINILYAKTWLNNIFIERYMLVAGVIYMKLRVAQHKPIRLWLFRDNFTSLEARYQLIKVLMLAKDRLK